ncbi:hypothetical protein Csa_017921, partial [Cucumis sativus]
HSDSEEKRKSQIQIAIVINFTQKGSKQSSSPRTQGGRGKRFPFQYSAFSYSNAPNPPPHRLRPPFAVARESAAGYLSM